MTIEQIILAGDTAEARKVAKTLLFNDLFSAYTKASRDKSFSVKEVFSAEMDKRFIEKGAYIK